jgi:LmbE family N-acetylglucosaminyl deacetylase
MLRLRGMALHQQLYLCGIALLCPESVANDVLPPLRPLLPSDSLLVVAPHPDDESLCCGGLIDTARRMGARVTIVWITFGDGFKWSAMVAERKLRPRASTYRDLAARRAGEARPAAAVLNVDPDSLFFLGYPDRGVLALLFDYYYPATRWRSRFTGANSVVYEHAVNTGASYDGANLERDFRAVLDGVNPTLVLAPSPQDTHPDHRGTGILVWRAMRARNEVSRTRFLAGAWRETMATTTRISARSLADRGSARHRHALGGIPTRCRGARRKAARRSGSRDADQGDGPRHEQSRAQQRALLA